MDEQIKKLLAPLVEYWKKQAPGRKKLFVAIPAAAVVFAIVLTLLLQLRTGGYEVLYSGISNEEATAVFSLLQDKEIKAQMDSKGSILVPKNSADTLRLELASMGYPKTGLNYDVFSSKNGLTTTESDKKVYLVQDLQNRAQATLAILSGVEKAVVTINLADSSNYVWEQNTAKSTASVVLTLYPGTKLTPSQVSAVKVVVATGLPKMAPEDVKVVDAATMTELRSDSEATGGMSAEADLMDITRRMEEDYEGKAGKQLSLNYGEDERRISVTVSLNNDKVISESVDYKPDQGNTGVVQYLEEQYLKDATNFVQGIPGEELNTDNPVPEYVDKNGDGTPEVVNHQRSITYAVDYLKKQVEKGNAELVSATMAVMLKDPNLDQQKRDKIIEQVSKATNIPVGNITVDTLDLLEEQEKPAATKPNPFADPVLLIVIGVGVLALLVIVFIISRMFGKKKKVDAVQEEMDAMELEKKRLVQETDEKKRLLREAADAKNKSENAITNEVRDFARDNPEITASLIRSWLKEDE
ncbi:MAG: flagellar basal-body MS-ring/collar protein FliF [Angelakisella sp.]